MKKHQKAFSLVEMLIVVLIMSVILGGIYVVLTTGQATWFTTDAVIQLQESLRKSLQRLEAELRQTQTAHLQVFDGTGVGSTDILRFSIPVICHAGNQLLDAAGDVAYWGAPLTWGCVDSSCMDADDDCAVLEYKYLDYRLSNQNQILRRVLDEGLVPVREDVFAENISDFQVTLNGKVVTFNVTAQERSANNRLLTAQKSSDVTLRN